MQDEYAKQTEKEIAESRSLTYRIRKILIKMGLLNPGPRDVE